MAAESRRYFEDGLALALLALSATLACRTPSTTPPDPSRAAVTSSSAAAANGADHEESEAGLTELRAATRAHPESARAWRELGDRAHALGRLEEAEAAWQKSLALDPAQADVHWALGTIYSGQNRDDRAQRAYESALRIDPEHHGALFNLGNLHLSLGRLDAAEDLLRRAAPRGGYGSLGRVYAAQGRWEEAAAAFGKGVAEPGDRAPLGKASEYADLGQALMTLRRDVEAARALTTSLEAYRVVERRHGKLEPGLGQVAYHLARLAARSGDIDQAQSYLEQAYQRDPELRRKSLGERDLDKVREAPGGP